MSGWMFNRSRAEVGEAAGSGKVLGSVAGCWLVFTVIAGEAPPIG
jgi:hypothetical protein